MSEHRLVDSAGMASILRTSCRHVQRLCERGEIPHFKVGRLLRFDPGQVLAELARRGRGVK